MNRKTTTARLTAGIAALALAAFGAVAVAAPANAAPGNVPETPGKITIHKFEQPDPAGGANNNGTPIPTTGWNALGDVEFKVQRITDVDLKTDAGWALAKQYAVTPADATNLADVATLATAVDGSAVFADLEIGAYLVTELESPDATLPNGDPANITMMAAPFVVTVPIPTSNGTWNSDVHVYPKNSLTQVGKTVSEPTGSGIGSTVSWTITADIPRLTEDATFTSFGIGDVLDGKLEFVAGSVEAAIGATPVSTFTPTHPGGLGGELRVAFTDMNVFTANQGATLTVTFDTIVRQPGAIVNEADVFINRPDFTNGVGTNTATTYWGPVQILKHAQGDATKTLGGAVFTVHETDAAGAPAISVGGQSQFTTSATDGTVTIPGLYVGTTPTASKTYYLREVTAPAGYELIATPIAVTVRADGVSAPVVVAVPNPQRPAFELPLTGGDGAIALTIAGGGLLAAALGVALVVARRRTQRAER